MIPTLNNARSSQRGARHRNSPRCTPRRILRIPGAALLALCVLAPASLPAQSSRQMFERAYALERDANDPEKQKQALQLYQAALSRGLRSDLARAARWRIFYLHRDLQDYPAALQAGAALGSSANKAVGDMQREMAGRWDVPLSAVEHYVAGVRALGSAGAPVAGDAARGENAPAHLKSFRRALAAGGHRPVFREAVLDLLVERGRASEALALLDAVSDQDLRLNRADLLVKLRRHQEAEALLLRLAETDNGLSDQDRARTLYLLGRIARARGDREEAVRYFRLAASYAEASQTRMTALAAYELYQTGRAAAAYALIRKRDLSGDPNMELLDLCLRYEVGGDRTALEMLRRRKPELETRARERSGGFLINKALGLLRRAGF